LVKDFLAKNNVTALEHPPYSTDFAPADFYLFLQLKSALKGWGFCDATDIIKNLTEDLKRLSQNGFQECS
jgi:transposase